MKIKFIFSGLIIALYSVFFSGCNEGEPVSFSDIAGTNGFSLGNKTELKSQTISAGGGAIDVSGTGSSIDGMSIDVPAGSYPEAKDYRVSTTEIKKHKFGKYFNPVTPLISIENGGGYSDKIIKLTIPISLKSGEHALAYYYDSKTGLLEGIPTLKLESNSITIGVRHFSDIVVASFVKELLMNDVKDWDTWFKPAKNGWPFTNYGAYPTYKGNCIGMSSGAIWFYERDKSNTLTSFFDNDQLWFKTPDQWGGNDDVSGIKFVTMIQSKIKDTWDDNQNITPFFGSSAEDNWWNFCHNMLINGRPELVVVGKSSNPEVAHAVIAYGWSIQGNTGKLKVYDPNFPKQEREISFDLQQMSFSSYPSGDNANDLTQSYDIITFLPLSTVIDKSEIDGLWSQVAQKTIGNGIFPEYKINLEYNSGNKDYSIELFDVTTNKTNYLQVDKETVLNVKIDAKDNTIDYKVQLYFRNNESDPPNILEEPKFTMEDDEYLIGVYISGKKSDMPYYTWIGYHWMKLKRTIVTIEPDVEEGPPIAAPGFVDTLYTFKANTEGKVLLNNYRFDWEVFDKNSKSIAKYSAKNDSVMKYLFQEEGSFTVKVKVFDESVSSKPLLGEATVPVIISDPLNGFWSVVWTLKATDRDDDKLGEIENEEWKCIIDEGILTVSDFDGSGAYKFNYSRDKGKRTWQGKLIDTQWYDFVQVNGKFENSNLVTGTKIEKDKYYKDSLNPEFPYERTWSMRAVRAK